MKCCVIWVRVNCKNKNIFFAIPSNHFFSNAIYDINIIISIFFAISSVSRLKSANLNWNIVCEACKKTRSKENWVCSLSKDLNSLTFLKSILTLQFDDQILFNFQIPFQICSNVFFLCWNYLWWLNSFHPSSMVLFWESFSKQLFNPEHWIVQDLTCRLVD